MIPILFAIRNFVEQAISIYSLLLIAYILMSWVPSMRETGFGKFLGKIVEPYLSFFRKFIPPLGMIDISPIVAIFALRFISAGVRNVFNMIINFIS
ncbi:YggT family protein [Sporosarcina sp. FA9]|uniref:YggT family protein n=1 Tax=Sporosarcina sp. FA9 TaxID=3413030 RepID=UPI003F65FA55